MSQREAGRLSMHERQRAGGASSAVFLPFETISDDLRLFLRPQLRAASPNAPSGLDLTILWEMRSPNIHNARRSKDQRADSCETGIQPFRRPLGDAHGQLRSRGEDKYGLTRRCDATPIPASLMKRARQQIFASPQPDEYRRHPRPANRARIYYPSADGESSVHGLSETPRYIQGNVMAINLTR